MITIVMAIDALNGVPQLTFYKGKNGRLEPFFKEEEKISPNSDLMDIMIQTARIGGALEFCSVSQVDFPDGAETVLLSGKTTGFGVYEWSNEKEYFTLNARSGEIVTSFLPLDRLVPHMMKTVILKTSQAVLPKMPEGMSILVQGGDILRAHSR